MLIVLPLSFLLLANASAKTTVTNRVNDGDVRVETSITTSVNGQTSQVTSNQPGDIKVTNINGQVQVETSEEITPTVSPPNITLEPILNSRPTNVIRQKITAWFNSFWLKLNRWWR